MLQRTNRQIVLAQRPEGAFGPDAFREVETQVPALQPGEVLVRNRWLSVDPYLRVRMNAAKSYSPPQPLDEVIYTLTAGEVIESLSPLFEPGDPVVGMGGWQQFYTADETSLLKANDPRVPLTAYLGPLGMTGITAWYGVRRILEPQAGGTVVVSAAAGAVGSVAGQLARLAGCRVVGIAGGPEKAAHVVRDLGFDACIDYKAPDFEARLAEATPHGVDGVFENVGGRVLDAVMPRLNTFARVAVCGLISGQYDTSRTPMADMGMFLTARITMRGFIVIDHLDEYAAARAELAGLLASGQIAYRESVSVGLSTAPAALESVLRGGNVGKQLVALD